MKVLDLQCAQTHVFEGWFSSEDDFLKQQAQALIHCPVCGSEEVSKRLSAPRLNFGSRPAPDATIPLGANSADPDSMIALQQQWLMACRHIVEHTVDVGVAFAEEARKIHYAEATQRAIRGKATPQEVSALRDEGIAVMPLLLPDILTGPTQ